MLQSNCPIDLFGVTIMSRASMTGRDVKAESA